MERRQWQESVYRVLRAIAAIHLILVCCTIHRSESCRIGAVAIERVVVNNLEVPVVSEDENKYLLILSGESDGLLLRANWFETGVVHLELKPQGSQVEGGELRAISSPSSATTGIKVVDPPEGHLPQTLVGLLVIRFDFKALLRPGNEFAFNFEFEIAEDLYTIVIHGKAMCS